MIKIAVDIMGGDKGVAEIFDGVIESSKLNKHVKFVVFGDKNQVKNFDNTSIEFIDIKEFVSQDDEILHAMRNKNTSMRLCIDYVANGYADAVVSAGNTGVLFALSKMIFKTINLIDKPAICSFVPTEKTPCVVLDVGANLEYSSDNLFQFAFMGKAFFNTFYKKHNARIGILNIGSEESKGYDVLKHASLNFKDSFLKDNFIGFVEPSDVFKGNVDIVVTDGFTGNIFIKTAEATGTLFKNVVKKNLNKNLVSMISSVMLKKIMKSSINQLNPSSYNGGMFLGLDGIVVKSHGGADSFGFCNAINVAINLVEKDVNSNIKQNLK